MQYATILSLLFLWVGCTEAGASQTHKEGECISSSSNVQPSPILMENTGILDWLTTGNSEMNEVIRTKDWSTTSLGPVELWPSSLTVVFSNCLSAHFPMGVYWGPNLVFFYNDAMRHVLGDKHPQSLGRNACDVWHEIWDIVGPDHERVYETGQSFLVNDQPLLVNRFGYLEEVYFNYSLSPIKISDGTVGGVLVVGVDNTYRVLNERRQKLLRELAYQTASAKGAGDVCMFAANVFIRNPVDIPFGLIYLIDRDSRQAHLAGSSGFQANDPLAPDAVDLTEKGNLLGKWPINIVVQTAMAQKIPDLSKHFGVTFSSYWPGEATREALLLPIRTSQNIGMFGVLVAGINPRRALDNDYRTFFDLVSEQIATAIVNARAYEEEKLHTKRLEELDRAKTVFFSNISHEFRTPLTLILSPLEDALADQSQPLPDCQFKRIEMVKRNAFRLLKLVNSLLDFSRIEAGRMQAHYVPTDLAKYTANLVSVFRSAIEKAGLILHVDMGSIEERVYIDKNSWEKIIFNLLSNALKFTHQGSVKVTVKKCGERIEVQVIDTGIGIPKQELPHMFERFHRIENVHGRSQEGTGIGLALTQELVKLHGGSIQVESEEGKGSVFTVSIPLGKAHLPPDRVHEEIVSEDSSSTLSIPFVEEALCWLPAESKEDVQEKPIESTTLPALAQPTVKETVLLADDNSDMREYVRQLLSGYWKVYAVADGEAALQAARDINPALILSDVMMPKMDGFQLTQELRKDPRTSLIPIILLSARAGEESSREGLQQGADDYMVKPFTANALITRVKAHMELGRLRIQLDKAVKERTHELQETIAELEKTASDLKKSEENYRTVCLEKVKLLHQTEYSREGDDFAVYYKTFKLIIQNFIDFSESEYGFIGELFYDVDHQPFLQQVFGTARDLILDEKTYQAMNAYEGKGKKFCNFNNVLGDIIATKKPLIINDVATYPKPTGIPKGHIPIHSFLGLPLTFNNEIVGIVALANKKQEYCNYLIQWLEPLSLLAGRIMKKGVAHKIAREVVMVDEDYNDLNPVYGKVINEAFNDDSISSLSTKKDVLILGAGISGLLAGKILQSKGYHGIV